jgi:hypothetical protein
MNFLQQILSGILHVIPAGFDHILFIISIIICLRSLRQCIIVSLIFTISHTISLFCSVFDIIEIDGIIIESIIAASILYSALSNLLLKETFNFKIKAVVIFLFGLIHGLGFASVFKEEFVNSNDVVIALLGFNIGVEIAQLFIVIIVYFLIINQKLFDEQKRLQLINIISMGIGIIAMFILISRLLN